MELKKIQKETEIEEGNLAGTSPAIEEGVEEDQEVNLNNATVPTVEEQENAGIETQPTSEDVEAGMTEDPTSLPANEGDPLPEPGTEPGVIDPELGLAEGSATKTFTQSQVDEIAGKIRKETREKVTRSFLDRYGVNSEEELDDLFGDAQRYTTVQDMYDTEKKTWEETNAARDAELMSVKERVALLESGIDKNRYEDAKLILKGKGLEVTVENIQQELATHPEWKSEAPAADANPSLPFRKAPVTGTQPGTPGSASVPPQGPAANTEPATTVDVLGNNSSDNPQPELSERERALRMFKV